MDEAKVGAVTPVVSDAAGEDDEDGGGGLALVLSKDIALLVHPGKGRLAALRERHGWIQVLRFSPPSRRATSWAQWLSALCALVIAGLCAAVAIANFSGFSYVSAGKCFVLERGGGLPSGLAESRVTVFVLTVLLGSLAFFLLCSIPLGVIGRFFGFWVGRQKILFALIMPLWFVARALVRNTVRNDVALLLSPLVIASLDLMSVIAGRGSRLFSATVRIMALCLAADFVSVYVVGVAARFECGLTPQDRQAESLARFLGVKASEFLNSVFCVELISIFARKVKEPVGVSVSFSDRLRFVVQVIK